MTKILDTFYGGRFCREFQIAKGILEVHNTISLLAIPVYLYDADLLFVYILVWMLAPLTRHKYICDIKKFLFNGTFLPYTSHVLTFSYILGSV